MSRKLPKYVQGFVDSEGRPYNYFRRPGYPRVRLPGLPWSPEFMAAYSAALKTKSEIGATRLRPGSVGAAVAMYFGSLAFTSLGAEVTGGRRSILEKFRAECGSYPMATLPAKFINAKLHTLRPFSARNWLKALRGLCRFCVEQGMCRDDVTRDIRLPKVRVDGHHTWDESEIARYEAAHPIGTKARLAFGLLIYTAQRRGDVIRMGRQHIRDGLLMVRQSKTGVTLAIPVHSNLQHVLDATPGEHPAFSPPAAAPTWAIISASNFALGASRPSFRPDARCTGCPRLPAADSQRLDVRRTRSRQSAVTRRCARLRAIPERSIRRKWRTMRWRG